MIVFAVLLFIKCRGVICCGVKPQLVTLFPLLRIPRPCLLCTALNSSLLIYYNNSIFITTIASSARITFYYSFTRLFRVSFAHYSSSSDLHHKVIMYRKISQTIIIFRTKKRFPNSD